MFSENKITPSATNFCSNSPFDDLDPWIDLALDVRGRRRRRRFAAGDRDLNSVASNPNFELLRFDFPNFDPNFGVELNLQRQIFVLQARFQRRDVGAGGELSFRARNDALQRRDVLRAVGEAGEGSVGDVEAAGDESDRDRVVEEGHLLVRVPRGDGEVEGGG